MEPIIELKSISKVYQQRVRSADLRHEAANALRSLVGRGQRDELGGLWALRDISLSIYRGESVAIVGRNGSGKTTLLRMLSGITEPTAGQISVQGRFVPLIGLSAGFDFERTGIQNIYLNAAIYGVLPAQTNEIIDDIIAFSELGDFLNTPVKRYSSGMVARLGFSIAVHILPDIVFLDEILSVGDAAFQEKCEARIHGLKERQSTILFVSHEDRAIRDLCERTIWINKGELIEDGPTEQVLEHYHDFLYSGAAKPMVPSR